MFEAYKIQNGSLKKYIGLDEHAVIPDGVTKIKEGAFKGLPKMTSVKIADSVASIEHWAFDRCLNLSAVIIPNSVTKISGEAFFQCPRITIVCEEGSYAHRYAVRNHMAYIFDYQYEAFHGVIPPGIEILSSPFLADEEPPFVFISYSHKDRDEVLKTIKKLYESGWKIWYDEGLTIGDMYDLTLEEHVRDCAAFLLYVTQNSLRSGYVRDHEIPWAISYGRPIIKCIAREGLDYEIEGDSVTDTVALSEIPYALEKVEGLRKGEPREARGISVAVDPAARVTTARDGFAYCVYSQNSAAAARSILLEAEKSGCVLYNASESGESEKKLSDSACLIVFLDKAFLADARLKNLLAEEYRSNKDIAVCQLEDIGDDDLPEELLGLHLLQWLNFVHGINLDMLTKLGRHLQERGCRNETVLPGFDYKKTKTGIVIKRYTGMSPEPVINSEYGGIPVTEIADNAFKNCVHLKKAVIPEHVKVIGKNAFSGCTDLDSVVLPEGLDEIRDWAFENCKALESVAIPDSVTVLGEGAFHHCEGLRSVTIPGGVTRIGRSAFKFCQRLGSVQIRSGTEEIGRSAFMYCLGLFSVEIPDSVTMIGEDAFCGTKLTAATIPDSVERIGAGAFGHCGDLGSVTLSNRLTKIEKDAFCCTGLISVSIPDSVTGIGEGAFLSCKKLTSVVIPDSVTTIDPSAFDRCPELSVVCSAGSYTWNYCRESGIKMKSPEG